MQLAKAGEHVNIMIVLVDIEVHSWHHQAAVVISKHVGKSRQDVPQAAAGNTGSGCT